MNVEERLLVARIEGTVELHIVLLLELGWLAGPERGDIVDDIVLVRIHIFSFLPLLLLAEDHRNRHELAVLGEKSADSGLGGILCGVIIEPEGDYSTPVSLFARLKLIFRAAVTAPSHCLGPLLPRQCLDGNLFGYHESGIETEAEMADDASDLVLVLLEEFTGGGECDLVDVPVHLLRCHADTVIDDFQCLIILIQFDADGKFTEFALEVTACGEGLHLL